MNHIALQPQYDYTNHFLVVGICIPSLHLHGLRLRVDHKTLVSVWRYN